MENTEARGSLIGTIGGVNPAGGRAPRSGRQAGTGRGGTHMAPAPATRPQGTQSRVPQYLQWRASMSCPPRPQAGQAWLLTAAARVACASSTDTMPVGTAMMP